MKAGGKVTYTIPKCIPSGNYLVRHELIALHSAYTYPGVQFYPGCHQLKVVGGGSKNPSGLVAFPGAYKASDAGITVDAYKGTCERVRVCDESLTIYSTSVQDSWTCSFHLLDKFLSFYDIIFV
jgi:hypothetical protein